MNVRTVAAPYIDLRTIHEAENSWWWADTHVHNSDYTHKVNEAIRIEHERLCAASDTLVNDTSYCCQWEGVKVMGADLAEVSFAAQKLAQLLARYKFVKFLKLD